MTPLDQLLLTLGVIYLVECVFWLPRGTVVVPTRLNKHGGAGHPSPFFGNIHGGVVLLSPVPFDLAPIAQQPMLSLSPGGVLAYVAQCVGPSPRPPQTEVFYPFSDIKTLAHDGRRLLINGSEVARLASPVIARRWARSLRRLLDTPPDRRQAAIAALLARSLDYARLGCRMRRISRESRLLRGLASSSFLFLFVLLPVMQRVAGLAPYWAVLLPAFLFLHLATLVEFQRLHRRFAPRERGARVNNAFLMLLAPTVAMRSADLLSRDAAGAAHPLALALAFAGREQAETFAAATLRDAVHPMVPPCPLADPRACEAERAFRSILVEEMRETLRRFGLDPARLLAPPPGTGPQAAAYCPRCTATFIRADARCEACGGLEVIPRPDGL